MTNLADTSVKINLLLSIIRALEQLLLDLKDPLHPFYKKILTNLSNSIDHLEILRTTL